MDYHLISDVLHDDSIHVKKLGRSILHNSPIRKKQATYTVHANSTNETRSAIDCRKQRQMTVDPYRGWSTCHPATFPKLKTQDRLFLAIWALRGKS